MRIPRLWYLIAWVLPLAACGTEESPADATLVYLESSGGSASRIIRVAADGSHRKVLWDGNGYVSDLHPSPDGRRILFGNSDGWYLLPSDGGAPTSLAVPANVNTPVWSPDGSAIAWSIYYGEDYTLRYTTVVAPGGTTGPAITPDSVFINSSAWAPGGQQLVVCGFTSSGISHLYVVDRDGGNFRAITPDTMYVSCRPAWAPGNLIAFNSGGIRTIAPDGTGLKSIRMHPFPLSGIGSGPVFWSPNGRYLSLSDGNGALMSLEVESGDLARIAARVQQPDPWSPQGELIAFVYDSTIVVDGYGSTHTLVGVARADGSNRKLITADSLYSSAPVWLNDPS